MRVPDERLAELADVAERLAPWPEIRVELPEFAANVADLRAARADNQRLRQAFGAYRSALLSGEHESEQVRVLAQAALGER